MNGGLLKQGRYYKPKGLLHTISVTNLSDGVRIGRQQ